MHVALELRSPGTSEVGHPERGRQILTCFGLP